VVEKLRVENAIYLIDDSRANIAGIPEHDTDKLAKAILGALA